MSNYVFGFFQVENEKTVVNLADILRAHSAIGFHLVEPGSVPLVASFPRSKGTVYFCLSDSNATLDAGELLFESDWASDCSTKLPLKLTDRIALIVSAVKTIAELSGSPAVGLWLSECDQVEGFSKVPLSSLFDVIASDFERGGIPCILYEVAP